MLPAGANFGHETAQDFVGRRVFFFFFMDGDVPQLTLRLETNENVPAELTLAFVAEIVRFAKSDDQLGPQTQIEIVEMGRGSLVVRLAVAASIAAIGQFGLQLYDRLTTGEGRVSEMVAEACLDHGVSSCKFEGGDTKFEIQRYEMPAVDRTRITRQALDLLPGSAAISGKERQDAFPRQATILSGTVKPGLTGKLLVTEDGEFEIRRNNGRSDMPIGDPIVAVAYELLETPSTIGTDGSV